MLNAIINNLTRLQYLDFHVPLLIQTAVVVLWVYILVLKLKLGYQLAIYLSLLLLMGAFICTLLQLTSWAGLMGEYAFLFLGVGAVQMFLTTEVDRKK